MQSSIGSKTRIKPWLFGGTAVGILAVSAIVYLHFTPSTPTLDLANTVLVQSKDLQMQTKANGVVQPVRKINVSPKEAGRLVQLLVREGDQVQVGQTLARMDNEQLQAQVQQYGGVLARAQAELAQRLAGNRREEIAKAAAEVTRYEAQLQEARSRLQLAKGRVDRKRLPAQEGAISRDALDESLMEERNARDNLSQVQASLAVAQQELLRQRRGYRMEEIAQSRAQVIETTAQLQVYQTQLSNTLVRAPFAGTITRRYADVGDFVTPTTSASTSDGATSASIVELSSGLEVEAKVPEASIAQIRTDQPVEIRSDSYPNQTFQGRVRLIAPRAVQENNITSFRVRVRLQSGLKQLKAGMNTRLGFLGQPVRQVLVVPLAAVVTQKDGQKGVWRVETNGNARFQTLQLGVQSSSQAQVLAGLKLGDRILLSPPANQPIPGVDNTEGTGL